MNDMCMKRMNEIWSDMKGKLFGHDEWFRNIHKSKFPAIEFDGFFQNIKVLNISSRKYRP